VKVTYIAFPHLRGHSIAPNAILQHYWNNTCVKIWSVLDEYTRIL